MSSASFLKQSSTPLRLLRHPRWNNASASATWTVCRDSKSSNRQTGLAGSTGRSLGRCFTRFLARVCFQRDNRSTLIWVRAGSVCFVTAPSPRSALLKATQPSTCWTSMSTVSRRGGSPAQKCLPWSRIFTSKPMRCSSRSSRQICSATSRATTMSDVLPTNPDDDVFWPPTERTEAEAHEVATRSDVWIFGFLGSRVQSFSSGPDRVIVYCLRSPAVDAWARGPRFANLLGPTQLWSGIPAGWQPRPLVTSFTSFRRVVVSNVIDPGASFADLLAEADAGDSPTSDLESAIVAIKKALGLTDTQLESATGVSRSTLWRLRTGRTSDTRSLTEAPVWRLHALATALVRRLGLEGARGWLHAGDPSPASLLSDGRLSDVEQAIDRVLFPDPARARRSAAVAADDYSPTAEREVGTAPASPRPPRRGLRPGRSPT